MSALDPQDSIAATCVDCGYLGSLAALALHSCAIQEQGGRCDDFPACGHTDGDGCQTLPTHTSAYYLRNPAATHLGCDHNTGHCEYEEEPEDDAADWIRYDQEAEAEADNPNEDGFTRSDFI